MPLLTDREVDDELASDWKEIRDRHAAEDEGEAPAAKGGKGAAEELEESAEGGASEERAADDASATPEQPRDRRSGRYKPAAKEKARGEEEPPAGRAAKDDQATEREGQHPAVAQPQQRDITRAPTTWSPKERAAWANVPQEARAAIHRREADFMAGQAQVLPDAQLGAELRQVLDPYRMLIESEGGTPAAAVQDLFRTAAVLRTGTIHQKYQTAANILNRFGLDPRMLVPRQFLAPNGQVIPPTVPAQQDFRDPRVDQILHNMQTEQQQRAAYEQREAEGLVTRWMNETDREGNPRRPYVGDVIDAMSAMIPQMRAQNPALTYAQVLEAAYEAAIWANPEIRQLLQSQQQTATDATRRAESQRRTEAARRGASVNVPRRGSAPRRPTTGSMEETIADTARELGLIQS